LLTPIAQLFADLARADEIAAKKSETINAQALDSIADKWLKRAATKFRDSWNEAQAGRRGLETAAMCEFNCAMELKDAIGKRDS